MTVGEWIRAERQARGWSRDQLAFRCHVAARLLAKYETGKSEPGAANLKKIADAYGIELPWGVPPSGKDERTRVLLHGDPLVRLSA